MILTREPDYSSLRQVDIIKLEEKKTKTYRKVIYLFPLILIFIFLFDYKIAISFSLALNPSIFLIKLLIDKFNNIQFLFLPPFTLNKINTSQEKKQEAINYKVTNFDETNPIRIMEDNSGKRYSFYNTTNPYLKYI